MTYPDPGAQPPGQYYGGPPAGGPPTAWNQPAYPPQSAGYPAQSGYPAQPGQYPAAPPPMYGGYGYPVAQPGNGVAVTAMVLGILGLVFFWFPYVDLILQVLAIIFGGVGISKANRGASGKGMAVAGLVCGLIGLLIVILIIIVAVNTANSFVY